MIGAFICANIYGLLHVCAVQTIQIYRQPTSYKVLLTDTRWYEVNECTAKKAVVGKPFKRRNKTTFCL